MKISFFARNHSHCQPLHEHGACKSGNHLQPNPACTFRAFPVKWAAKGRRKTMVKTGSTRLHERYCNLTPSSTFRRALHSSKFLAAYHANIRPFLDQTVCRCCLLPRLHFEFVLWISWQASLSSVQVLFATRALVSSLV